MLLILLLTTTTQGSILDLIGPSGGRQDDGWVDQTHLGPDDGWGDESDCDGLSCYDCTSYHNDCVYYRNECIMWNDVPEFAADSDVTTRPECGDQPKPSSGWEPPRAFDQSNPGPSSWNPEKFTGSCKNLGCVKCTEYHTPCVFYKNKCMDWQDPPLDAENEDYTAHVKCPGYVLRYEERAVGETVTCSDANINSGNCWECYGHSGAACSAKILFKSERGEGVCTGEDAKWWEYKCMKPKAEESVAMAQPVSADGSQSLVVTGFALIGLGALIYGAGKHYLGGKHDESRTPIV